MNDELKRQAARAAVAELPEHGALGLGTGSTVRYFFEALAELVQRGRRFQCVPTSNASRALAVALGVPLLDGDGPWDLAVTVDGADEVSDALELIKGGGGAHTREKIVNYSSRRNVIIVDASKRSTHLGQRCAVPVEVLPFAHLATRRHLEQHGVPALRLRAGAPVRTDTGNLIYDLACGPLPAPAALDAALHAIPGVVETGLFLGRADVVLVAGAGGVARLTPP